MEEYTVKQVENELPSIIDCVVKSHDPVRIVSGKNKVVLISEEGYRALIETIHLTSAGMNESILLASKEPLEAFYESIDWN